MSSRLSEGQVDDLLEYCGTQPQFWKQGETLICCPVHGESNPSMGVSIDKQICHCFSCGFAGDFAKLLMCSRPEEFGYKTDTPEHEKRTYFKAYRNARDFLAARYELEYRELGRKTRLVKRYEQVHEKYLEADTKRVELPRYKLAPFKSGKETFGYFFNRGFNIQDMKDFMIGRDTDNETVTIPVFYEDGVLAGIIGRYIDKNRKKNQRYKIYADFERSKVLYPLNKAKPINDTIIIVEGQFDAIRMHKLGYTNTYAIMTDNISEEQIAWVVANCSCVIWVGDNDVRGIKARDKARQKLKNRILFKIVDYPEFGKDVFDWTDAEIEEMIENAHSVLNKRLKRL